MQTEKEIKQNNKLIPVVQNAPGEKPSRVASPRIDHKVCTSSYNCVVFCPHDAININDKGKPVVDLGICTGCLICLRECPSNAISESREII